MSEPPAASEAAQPHPPADPAAVSQRWRALELIKDNVEAFTIALVMALVIKHFCVEAFKIPTGSMEPTLIGERGNGVGDRILVDKLAYLTSGPQRWDVIVFRFPLNKAKHFIKRVAGVGGEYLKILRGDIWVRRSQEDPWRVATKPRRVREELYRPVFPIETADAVDDAASFWALEEGWSLNRIDALRFEGGPVARARLEKRIGSSSSNRHEGRWGSGDLVQDVRIRARIVPEEDGRVTLIWRTGEDRERRISLGTEGQAEESYASLRRPGRAVRDRLDARLRLGQATTVELECVDGEVHVHVDGRPLLQLGANPEIDDLRAFEDFEQAFEIEAVGGAVEVDAIRVDRDLYYQRSSDMNHLEGSDGLWVPDGHYFVLGDNTTSSHDSRKWELYHVPLEDGREVLYYYDSENPLRHEDGLEIVTDWDGIERSWSDDEIAASGRTTKAAPFVPRELVVGRAFMVFWPLSPDFPGRVGFIH